MKFKYLGKTGLKVSNLVLGTMNFGDFTEEKEAFAIMDYALDAGINFFDTANVYGMMGPRGRTEEIIGRWFKQGNKRRERVVLATKVYGDMQLLEDGPNSGNGLSAYKIRRHFEASLKRLQTDHIELYQMHQIDRHTSWEELWGVFERLVNQGKVDYIGSSNFPAFQLALAQAEASKRNFLGLVSEQHQYSLLCRLPELEVLPAAKKLELGVITWSPLGGGRLSGKILNAAPGTRSAQRAASLNDYQRKQLEAYSELCKELGESEANVALAWILANPVITAPIIGPRTVKQLEGLLRASEIVLTSDVLGELDNIFPGPGGEAPEAYMWN